MRSELVEHVRSAVGDASCVIALGGGADSSVLLSIAVEALGVDHVRGVFVYHGLEGSDSLKDAVIAAAENAGVDLDVVEALVEDGSDLEARARHARYAALSEDLRAGELCCTGHTHDDQAETVLMRLMRGSGPTGIAGIPAKRDPFVRPLLAFSRADLRAFADREGLPYTDDPANSDARFMRSRIRGELIPTIEESYAPSLRENLVRVAGLVAMDDGALNEYSDSIPARFESGEVAIPTAPLLTAGIALSTRAVRRALHAFHDPFHGTYDDVAAVMHTAADGSTRTLTGGIVCIRENAEVVLVHPRTEAAPEAMAVRVGERFSWGGLRFTSYMSMAPSLHSTVGQRTAMAMPPDGQELAVRGVGSGDRIEIDGGSTPVSELLRAGGVPVRRRPFWMVVTIGAKIAALHGIKVAAWARPVGGDPALIIETEGRA